MNKPHYLGARTDRTSKMKYKCTRGKCRHLATHHDLTTGVYFCIQHARESMIFGSIPLEVFPEYRLFLKQMQDWAFEEELRRHKQEQFFQ